MDDTNETQTPLWERVKNLQEENAHEIQKLHSIIGEIETMLEYNYGKQGKCILGIVSYDMRLMDRIVTVLNYYDRIYRKQAIHKEDSDG